MFFDSPASKQQIAKERLKARELRQSSWWKQKLSQGLCHFCEKQFSPSDLTMDHLVPISRGGRSTKGNAVVACKECNNRKKYLTPVDLILEKIDMGKEPIG